MAGMPNGLTQRFRHARRDPTLTVLEGFHALKHAVRFGAELVEVVASEPRQLGDLAAALAPDLAHTLRRATIVGGEVLAALAPQAPRTGVMAIAHRPVVDVPALLADQAATPVVFLEDPRTLGNLGASVRVAAGAGAAGVLTTGAADPWHPDALRGAAGLHYALPVARIAEPMPAELGGRLLLAIDPEGDELDPATLPSRSVLAFGTERHGLSDALLKGADGRIRIPMRDGVSSLNLATSVAAVLYAWRLRPRET